MILEKRLAIPDSKYPNTSGSSIPTLDALVIGQGASRNAPSIITIEMEMKSWKEEKTFNTKNNNEKTYRLQEIRTVLYEFNAETGALERACTYRGNKFKEKHFRFYERLIDEWVPAKNRKVAHPASYNATIAKAYNAAEKIRQAICDQKNRYGCKTKEKENMEYFLRGLQNICNYDKEKIKIKQ
jgi:regulator of sigma D